MALTSGIVAFLSESLPFVKQIKGAGLLHAAWTYVCESGCLKPRKDAEPVVRVKGTELAEL